MDTGYTAPRHDDAFPLMGAQATVLADGPQTAGAWEALEMTLAPGARSPLHTLAVDKLFYVAAGRVTLVLGGETVTADAGGFAHVPAGTPHCYRNDGDDGARLVVVVTGAGQVAFLRGMSALTAGGPPDPAAVAAHAAGHGVAILPTREA
ncbi:cupin domain-containing protein [Modestobacter sp. NPDC049651]|uniref:cupin domain-containing protein n=1 Tax=unclassified Modestobacter TaxID=2643866 RepID=UPI0033F94477